MEVTIKVHVSVDAGNSCHVSYLFKTARISSNAGCRACVLPFAPSPCADVDAPLEAFAGRSASLRFAIDGDEGAGAGAGGSEGGVRVPLAAAMMTCGCCWRCANDGVGCNALRAAEVVVSRSP